MDRESDREIDDQLDRDHEREGDCGTYKPLRRRQAIPIMREPTGRTLIEKAGGELNPPVKAASEPCPNDHEQLKADPTLFAELALCGHHKSRDKVGPYTLELRQCNLCQSTLSRKVRA